MGCCTSKDMNKPECNTYRRDTYQYYDEENLPERKITPPKKYSKVNAAIEFPLQTKSVIFD